MNQFDRHRMKLYLSGYALSVLIIIAGSIYLGNNLEHSRHQLLEKEFQKAQELLIEKVESFVYGLQGMGGLYLAKKFIHEPQAIKTYADFRNNFNNFPGALGYGFIRAVPKVQRDSYVAMMKRKSADFKIKSLGDDSHTHYYVIETIEPFIRNTQARFLDVGSEQIRRKGALQAIDSAEPVLTGAISLVQADKDEAGFLYLLPLYHTKLPPFEVEERRRQIAGFAYAPILLKPLMNYLQEYATEKLYYKIFDITDGENTLLFEDGYYGETERESVIDFKNQFEVGGRLWLLQATKVDPSLVSSSQGTAFFVGFILWLIITVLFWQLQLLQKKRLEQSLVFEKVRSLQRSILDAATYSIISTDVTGVITTFNHAAEKLLGYDAAEVVGKVTPSIIHLESEVLAYTEKLNSEFLVSLIPGFETFIYRTRLEGTDTQEWTYVRRDGRTFPVRLTTTVIKDEVNQIIGYLGVAQDLSKEKELQATVESQQALMLASAKMSALGEMAAGVSHEINNPLTIISGLTSILEIELESSGRLEADMALPQLKKIQKTINRISKIVQGLRSFARESSVDKAQVTEISEVIHETLTFCQERFRIHGVDLQLAVEENLLVKVHLTQLSQVILNLLNNSYDAIAEQPQKWIKLEAQRSKGSVLLTITDSGAGIPEDIRERMMEPFFTSKEVGKGTGLGLSISLGIIRSYGGNLEYNADHPHTQFIIELPLVAPEA